MNNYVSNNKFKSSGAMLVLCVAALAVLVSSVAVAQEERVYTRIGGANSISRVYTEDRAALQQEFQKFWPDLKRVLAKAKWDGNPDDLYKAVMDESYGQVTAVAFPVNGRLEWMAFRWEGRPQVKRNIRWGGAEPLEAWKIAFTADGKQHVFIVPKVCLNLALYYPPPAPACTLTVSPSEVEVGKPFTVEVSGEGGSQVALEVQPPVDGKQPYVGWQASPFKATMQRDAAGTYTFKGYARTELGEASSKVCEGEVTVKMPPPICEKPEPPVCKLALSAAEAKAGDEFTVDMSGSAAGGCVMDGKCVKKGECDSLKSLDVVITDAAGAGVGSMSLDLGSKSGNAMVEKRGSYTVKGTVTTAKGLTASCDAGIEILPKKVWIVRPYAAQFKSMGDGYDQSVEAVDGAGVRFTESRLQIHSDEGIGLGIDVERKFNDRTGFVFGIWSGQFDLDWMLDTTLLWLMGEEDLSALGINLGVNFHMTPGKKVDFYLGPLASFVQLDDYTLLVADGTAAVSRNVDYGDEFALGAQLGLDIPLKDRWAFSTSVRYLDLKSGSGGDFEIDFDPLILTAGFAFTF